mmetsp:Transcript_14004/g.18254  ORF Transcript_14004/g.18254 Transcript_14004/m.18254 type:complete len:147 (-) Transcript_14004:298-738(-)|eukprot:CAMPEP_0198144704 /NCGR_PEP_ID=MMETSP1443-20131203/17951_1 /TAXON_ID=186043 /ORGANISM="Entomoneis sp., Strain CCMP2396" /LENGTH=146 /DNA_ID=CAMNT_0043808155 /DNA_START=156 /DNA_END=596 /DNA_ORIENTATION=+
MMPTGKAAIMFSRVPLAVRCNVKQLVRLGGQPLLHRRWLSSADGEKRSTAIPHAIIFGTLCLPVFMYAAYSATFGPSEEEMIAKVEGRYKKEIEKNLDNCDMQKKIIQRAMANPDSMDEVTKELLEGGKQATKAQTKRLAPPSSAA